MVTSSEEFFANLFALTDGGNVPQLATLLPKSESIYNIDLNSRTIEAPEFLSVRFDHNSETVFFIVDRYYDNQDLSETCCVIQYINAKQEGRFYVVPYYDIVTFREENKMIIPWCIEGEATKAAGEVTYSIRFFKTDVTGKKLIYNLNTLSSTSTVLNGMNVLDYYKVELTPELYQPGVYYVKNSEGNFVKSELDFDARETYYALSDKYAYESDTLDAIYDRLAAIEKEHQDYWYEV